MSDQENNDQRQRRSSYRASRDGNASERRQPTPRRSASTRPDAARRAESERARAARAQARREREAAQDARGAQSQSASRARTQEGTRRSVSSSAARQEGARRRSIQDGGGAPARERRVQRQAANGRAEKPRTSSKTGAPKPNVTGATPALMKVALGVFAALMACGLVVGLVFPRPAASELENRQLTAFPAITLQGILDGQFFSDLSLWYSDTYPLREMLVSADRTLEGLFGIQPSQQLVGTDKQADEISTAADTVDVEARQSVEVPTEEAMAEDIQGNIMGRLYVEDDAAYSVYYFSQEAVQQYAAAMSIAAQRLEGQADVYSIIVPNNSAVMLSESTLESLGGTDQAQAIDYFYSLYDPLVHTVKVLDVMRQQNGQYLYFRTDHHWTADGAYVAYQQFCERKGIEPVDKEALETKTFQPFLGSYYTQLDLQSMADNPDYVKTYYPEGTNTLIYWNDQGDEVESSVIQDVDGWADSSLYNAFICGDQPLAHIYNPNFTDDSSVLLVKDSFGCAFAPWLANSYQNVWIIDFRYTDQNIVDFVQEHGIQDVIFLNNIEIAGTTTVANMLTSEVTE